MTTIPRRTPRLGRPRPGLPSPQCGCSPPRDSHHGRGSASRILLLAAAIVVLIAAIVLFRQPAQQALRSFVEWSRGVGPWGAVLLGAAYIPACVFFIPGSLLTLGAGFAFGVVRGAIAVSLGSTIGAAVAFLAGRTLARRWIEKKVSSDARFHALDEAVAREGWKIVLLTRLSPIFPFNLLNYMFGLTKVRLRDYILASWIGMLPGTLMYVYLGSLAQNLAEIASGTGEKNPLQQVLFAGGLAATVLVTIFVTRVARRALREATQSPATASGNPAASTP